MRRFALAAVLIAAPTAAAPADLPPEDPASPPVVEIFRGHVVHFTPDDPHRWDTGDVVAEENGRLLVRTIAIEPPAGDLRITATVRLRPIPVDESTVADRWDRAGGVRLRRPGEPDVEVVKFMTAYGGETEHVVDVSWLAPLLRGPCTFVGFVDTWTSPGWRLDFRLELAPVDGPETFWGEPTANPAWARGVLFENELTAQTMADGPLRVPVTIPAGTTRVELRWFTSGHCTDGRGADEFEPKDNVIAVDGVEVQRYRPWRTDCRRFRDRNPYCRRWTDGHWSSDFDRSGWCPGDAVAPLVLDLTDRLGPGDHELAFAVEGVRPPDDEGHHGVWRVSAQLSGWAGPAEPSGD